MPINSWDRPQDCCVLIKAKEEHNNPDATKNEILNILESFTVVLRGTEHGNCTCCEYLNTYGQTGQCMKRFLYDNLVKRREQLENSLRG